MKIKKSFYVILAIILIPLLLSGCKKDKQLLDKYINMFDSKKAHLVFSSEMETEGTKFKQAQKIAVNNEDMALEVSFEIPNILPPMKNKVILKDMKLYILDYSEKQAITMDISKEYDKFKESLENSSSYSGNFFDSKLNFIKSGKEDFKGENLYFEEYENKIGTFKYYFKEKNLIGVRSSIEGFDKPFIINVEDFSKDFPKDIFDIPEDFTTITAEEAGFQIDLNNFFK